jgi:hypothetical protein
MLTNLPSRLVVLTSRKCPIKAASLSAAPATQSAGVQPCHADSAWRAADLYGSAGMRD